MIISSIDGEMQLFQHESTTLYIHADITLHLIFQLPISNTGNKSFLNIEFWILGTGAHNEWQFLHVDSIQIPHSMDRILYRIMSTKVKPKTKYNMNMHALHLHGGIAKRAAFCLNVWQVWIITDLKILCAIFFPKGKFQWWVIQNFISIAACPSYRWNSTCLFLLLICLLVTCLSELD